MNRDLINNFRTLQDYFKTKGDKGRVIAYGKAVTLLNSLDFKITNVKQLDNIKGIGPKIKSKVKEYLETGKIRTVEEKKEEIKKSIKLTDKQKIIKLFTTVWGIGPAKAKALYDYKLRTINDLKKNKHLLTDQQKIGLKYWKDLLKRIPRENITVLYAVIKIILRKKFGKGSFDLTIAGSYRRKNPDSGDIDCLMSSNKFTLKQAVQELTRKKIIVDTLSMRDQKFMGIVMCPSGGQAMRLDIEFLPENQWGTAILYFTGSKAFNVHMRAEAKKQGYLLNEHGLFYIKDGKRVVEAPTEKEVFDILGMKYIPPERR